MHITFLLAKIKGQRGKDSVETPPPDCASPVLPKLDLMFHKWFFKFICLKWPIYCTTIICMVFTQLHIAYCLSRQLQEWQYTHTHMYVMKINVIMYCMCFVVAG